MINPLVVGVLLFTSSFVISKAQKSSASKLYEGNHTLRRYQGPSKSCESLSRGVEEKGAVVTLHNTARSTVASGNETRSLGGPMWDDELAAVAQLWADQCKVGHDTMRSTGKFEHVGQNLFTAWSTNEASAPNWTVAVSDWYNEVKGYNSSETGSFEDRAGSATIGHFTQVIWAKTTKVGCGYTKYKDPTKPEYPITQFYVCNYGTSGNFLRSPVYTTGTPCTACPAECSVAFPVLCSDQTTSNSTPSLSTCQRSSSPGSNIYLAMVWTMAGLLSFCKDFEPQ